MQESHGLTRTNWSISSPENPGFSLSGSHKPGFQSWKNGLVLSK